MHPFFLLLQEHAPICRGACDAFSENCKTIHLSKKELILSPGQQEDFLYLINNGIVRHYYRFGASHEWTSQFSVEGEIIFSPGDSPFDRPQEKYVEAYTPTSVLRIKKEDCVQVMAQYPELHQVFSKLSQLRLMQQEARLLDICNLSAQSRYQNLLISYPGLANRVRVKHLASYLGINPDTLSRIRRELSKGK